MLCKNYFTERVDLIRLHSLFCPNFMIRNTETKSFCALADFRPLVTFFSLVWNTTKIFFKSYKQTNNFIEILFVHSYSILPDPNGHTF